ncbi:uncharacterized protein TRAVEDRAFT_67776 [Trametes versicolor FP-101664 SS1]|uniref:uncharacterized protein n=1 Tax=Trametes versicolor (strain FP-101664) TaxID=717944 RepID=UPI0004622679|nr:uncharacterized protein TRAVEDRAFT_67776 [Trametes versicolor FP-101664 SS1]EIW63771.1 hypothetical protein TRAVEDRAFT_67776 [Trametes versicolor FP-101664 SS1]
MNRNSCLLSQPDVVHRICSRCDRSTLLSLSTTSRAFSTPALQKLWRSLASFAPIFLTLPEDAVKCTETSLTYRPFVPPVLLEVTRELTYEDLVRFRFYAPLVHDVAVASLPRYEIALSAWEALEHANPGPLPNLRHVGIFVGLRPEEHIFPPFYFLLGHELRHAQLCLNQVSLASAAEPDPNLNKLLASLPQSSPQTSLVTLEVYPPAPYARDILTQAVCGLSNLANLSVIGIPLGPSALMHLSTLPRLHHLRFHAQSSDYPEHVQLQLPPNSEPFSSLEILTIDADGARCVTTLLSFLRPWQLDSLDIKLSTLPSQAELTALSTAIAALPCREILGELVYDFPGGSYQPHTTGAALPWSAFVPLHTIPHIAALRLYGGCYTAPGDSEVAAMARAWPHLRALSLCDRVADSAGISLTALLDLVTRCDSLQELHIPLADIRRAECEDILSRRPPARERNPAGLGRVMLCKVFSLNVGRAAIAEADVPAVAAVLSMMFPEVETVWHSWRQPMWGAEDVNTDAVMYHRWQSVSAALRAFVKVRDEEQDELIKRLRAARDEGATQ